MKPTYEELTVQLANAESKCREMAVESAGLKNPDNWLSQSDYGYEASEVATQNGATEDESLRAGMIAIINRIGTPATDAFLAEVRASTLDEFAKAQDEQAKKYYELSPGCSAQDECQFAAGQAWYFAECIRKGAAL